MTHTGLVVSANGESHTITWENDTDGYRAIRNGLNQGWLEGVPFTYRDDVIAYADEEGLLKGLDANPVASVLLARYIVGPVVFVGHDGGPETVGLSPEALQAMQDYVSRATRYTS
jgi:hypothetical protein